MQDGLYIAPTSGAAHQWVADVEFAITLQANDLTKPDKLQNSYTNAVNLPDTNAVRELLRGCEQIDAGGPNPYRKLSAYVVKNGERLFSGFAILKSFAGGWSIELAESKRDLFEVLAEKSLRDLNLSHLDHHWDIPTITALSLTGGDVSYPLIDYGTLSTSNVPYDALFPAVRAKALIGQMLLEAGYRPAGGWLYDPLYEKLAVPFSESEATGHDQQWVDDRTARVTVAPTAPIVMLGGKLNQIIPLAVDGGPDKQWTDGKLNTFNTTLFAYTAPEAMRLTVVATQGFQIIVDIGSVEVKLQLEKNGQFVEQGYWSAGGPHNRLFSRDEQVELNVTVDLMPGDQLKIRRVVQKRSTIAQWKGFIYNDPNHVYASFIPDKTIQKGDSWPVARNLPDVKCLDLLKSVAFLMSGWFRVNQLRMTCELVRVTDQTKTPPVDISTLVDESVEPTHTPAISGYGRRNLLKWKEADGVDTGYGDGVLEIDADSIDAEKTLFTLPFSASMDSEVDVTGYGRPLRIETRTTTTSGETTTITRKQAAPRLILIEPSKTFEVPTKILSGTTITDSKVTLIGAWFATRPGSIRMPANAFSLAFDGVPGQIADQTLIERYYGGLKSILRRPRTFAVSLFLRPADVLDLDLAVPVLLRRVRIGAQEIGNVHFLINQIPNYRDGYTSTATLIPFYPGGAAVDLGIPPDYGDDPPLDT